MRLSSFLFAASLLLACSRNGKPATAEPPPRSPSPTIEAPPARTEAGAGRRVVSVQRNSPGHMNAISEYCILGEDGRAGVYHEGLPYRVGGVNLRLAAGVAREALEKVPALLVTAVLKPDLSSVLTRTGRPCSRDGEIYAQARSDWGTPECGQGLPCFTSLAALARFSYWEVSEIRDFEGFTVTPTEDRAALNVRIRNVFTTAQPAMEFVAHYEGGPGKPMARFLKHPIPALAPGQEHVASVPLTIDGDEKPLPIQPASRRGNFFELASLDWEGSLLDGDARIPIQVSHFVYRQYRDADHSK
jgi:hypothetical protein